MDSNKTIIIVDGTNNVLRLFFRSQKSGHAMSISTAFLSMIFDLKMKYKNTVIIVAWDYKSKRRVEETDKAKLSGVITTGYKEMRKKMAQEDKDLISSVICDIRENILPKCNIADFRIDGYEADDIINTLCALYRMQKKVIYSDDKDFYRLLDRKTICLSPRKNTFYNYSDFVRDFGFEPCLYTDYGAIVGEKSPTGDNICGVKGCGDVFAKKVVQKYGVIDNILTALRAKENRNKQEEIFVNSEAVLRLSYSLKKMDLVPDITDVVFPNNPPTELRKWFIHKGLASSLNKVNTILN